LTKNKESDEGNIETFHFRVTYFNIDGKIMKSQIQEVPVDGKSHWSKVVKEEDV